MEFQIIPFKYVNIDDPFFDDFRNNYPEFNKWYERKKDDLVYIQKDREDIISFLKLKIEYSEINRPYCKTPEQVEKVLKVCSFKSMKHFDKKFMKHILEYAESEKVDVIYGTILISQQTIKCYELFHEYEFKDIDILDSGEIVMMKRISK